MVDETGFDAQKGVEKPAAPRPQEPPKESAPVGASEQKIINRIDQDGDEDRVLQDIAGEGTDQTFSIDKNRTLLKTDGAIAIISRYGSTPRESVEAEINKRADQLVRIINREGGSGYDLKGIAGETRVDLNGNTTAPQSVKPETALRLVTEYATSEAAISSLYTTSSDVQSLPPEAYRLELTDLARQIDENGVFLQYVGSNRQGIKTRFYGIPGKQLDADKKLIPPEQQIVLVVQDSPIRSEGYLRTYTVHNPEEIKHYLPDFIQAQRKQETPDNAVSAQLEPLKITEKNDDDFRRARIRIEKSKRIKDDISPADRKQQNRDRVQEIRGIEMMSSQSAKEGEMLEEMFDARGFRALRTTLEHTSPDGQQVISEDLVFFVKPSENGQLEYLVDQSGKRIGCNSDLIDSRLTSQKHASGRDYNVFTIPKIDGRGAYTGVISLQVDKDFNNSKDDTRLQKQETLASSGKNETSEPIQIQPIIDKLNANRKQITRLGIEVTLTDQEIAQINGFLDSSISLKKNDPQVSELSRMVDENRDDKAFGIGLFFNDAVRGDPNVTKPTITRAKEGIRIYVPPELFTKWKALNDLESARNLLEQYQSQPLEAGKNTAYGTLASNLADMIEKGKS